MSKPTRGPRGRRGRKAERGSAIIEIAIVVPLLAAMLLGTTTVASALAESLRLATAVRRGAQFGAKSVAASQDTAGMQQVVADELGSTTGITITATRFCECADGHPKSCNAKCGSLDPLIFVRVSAARSAGFTSPIFPNPIQIQEEAVMRVR